jgi:predicted MFS family arabinose efflux permease
MNRGNARLALLCIAQFVVVLDVTIVAIALPAIGRDLGFTPAGLQWVLSAYTLTFGGGLLLAGRAADLYGRRRVFRAGLLVFATASLACALAPSAGALIAARAVQGTGAALVAPSALALLIATEPAGRARSRALAVWTAAAAGGGASGWVLGGAITGGLGWEWVFAVNVPVGLAGAALAGRLLPEQRERRAALDTLGLAAAPLVALRALRAPGLARGALVAAALTGTTTPAVFLCVLEVQRQGGLAPAAAGLLFVPLNLAVIAGSFVSPRLEARRAMTGGLAAVAGAAALLAAAGAERIGVLLLAFALMGGGLGVASVASTASGTAAAGDDGPGLASGLLNTAAQLGTAMGLALLVPPAASLGFRWGWAGCAVIALSSSIAASRAAGSSATCGSASGSAYAPKHRRSRSEKTPTDSAWPSDSGIAGSTSTHSAPRR